MGTVSLPEPEICDGGFENGITSWDKTQSGGTSTIDVDVAEFQEGSQSAKIDVTVAPTSASQIQFASCKSDIEKDSTYTVVFWAKTASGTVDINAQAVLSVSPFTQFSNNSITSNDVYISS